MGAGNRSNKRIGLAIAGWAGASFTVSLLQQLALSWDLEESSEPVSLASPARFEPWQGSPEALSAAFIFMERSSIP